MSIITDIPSYQQNLQLLIEQLGQMIPEKQLSVFNSAAAGQAIKFPSPLKLKKDDKAPMFSLPNTTGKLTNIEKVLEQGPIVLTFYRGAWCPYCNLQLKNYEQILPQIKEAGGKLIAVSPMTPDSSLNMKSSSALQFEVLSDAGCKIASQYTTVFKNDDASIQAMKELGYDFFSFYNDESALLPVPATFVISQDKTILLAMSEGGDYRKRVEPQHILDALGE